MYSYNFFVGLMCWKCRLRCALDTIIVLCYIYICWAYMSRCFTFFVFSHASGSALYNQGSGFKPRISPFLETLLPLCFASGQNERRITQISFAFKFWWTLISLERIFPTKSWGAKLSMVNNKVESIESPCEITTCLFKKQWKCCGISVLFLNIY